MTGAIFHVPRLLHIVWVLLRSGVVADGLGGRRGLALRLLGWIARRMTVRRYALLRGGERLALVLYRLGPTATKFGQILSTREDLLGEAYVADLAGLRDDLPPFSGTIALGRIEQALGCPVGERYTFVEPQAVAAASIAQVHYACTTEGAAVAVKILRPGVVERFARDLAMLEWMARLAEALFPGLRRLRPRAAVEHFKEVVGDELDLRLEAAAASELRDNFRGHQGFEVPAVDWQRTTREVMTIEWVEGISLNDPESVKEAGFDPAALLAIGAEALFLQVFRDGFFHADQHPGNIFVTSEGKLSPVDFGIMGRLDRPTRRYLASMLRAFLDRDYQGVARSHFEAGYVDGSYSMERFAQACRSIAEPIFEQPLDKISLARLLGHLFAVTRRFDMHTQPQLLLLQKTMVQTEGLGRLLDPSLNVWTLTRPLIERHVPGLFQPVEDITREIHEMLVRSASIPETLQRITRQWESGEQRRTGLSRFGLGLGWSLAAAGWITVLLVLLL